VRRWIAEQTLPSAKLRGTRLVAGKDLERLLSPRPPNWDHIELKDEEVTEQ
jgi:hypothetical protein